MAYQNHSVAFITITVHFLQEFISYDFCHIFKGDLRPAEIKISCFCSKIIMFSKVKGFSNMVYNIFKLKVIPLKLFYYQTFFETWRNEHS